MDPPRRRLRPAAGRGRLHAVRRRRHRLPAGLRARGERAQRGPPQHGVPQQPRRPVAGRSAPDGLCYRSPRGDRLMRQDEGHVPSARAVACAALAVCVGYFIGANIGFILRLPPATPSVLWPPNSILTATLLLAPPRRWWIYLAAALPAHLVAELPVISPASLVLTLYATNCLEAVVGAAAVRILSDAPGPFRHPAPRVRLRAGRRHPGTVRVLVRGRRRGDDAPPGAVLARAPDAALLERPHRARARARHRVRGPGRVDAGGAGAPGPTLRGAPPRRRAGGRGPVLRRRPAPGRAPRWARSRRRWRSSSRSSCGGR